MSDRVQPTAPFPPAVRAFTTLRYGAGASAPPFDSFNLGNARGPGGDDPAEVARNRAELVRRFGLPSAPHWLRQVHGTRVVRFTGPPPGPGLPFPPEGGERSGGERTGVAWLRSGPPPQPSPASGGGGGPGRGGPDGSGPGGVGPGGGGPGGGRPGGGGRGGGGEVRSFPAASDRLPPPPAGEGWGGGNTPHPGEPGADSAGDAKAAAQSTAGCAEEPEADAAVTSTPGVVLAILTADCLPVVFAARDGTEVAIAHAGWQGLANGVLEATLAAMHTAPRELLAWIGPCAGPARYEVGRDVFDAFTAPDPDARAAFVPTREGHWRVDLPALARRRLAAAGMAPQAVHGGELCTISDPGRFFSHRRDRRSGRIATIAWIDPGAR